MTLHEFQTRLRTICDAHVTVAKSAQAAFDDGMVALYDEAVADWDADPEAFGTVVSAELARMQAEIAHP